MKERLTGAIILVALIVLLVPELLTGPIRTQSAPAASASVGAGPITHAEPPFRSYTLTLGGAPQPHDNVAAATVARTQAPSEAQATSPAAAADSSAPSAVRTPEPNPVRSPARTPARREAAGLQPSHPSPSPVAREARASGSSTGWVVQLGSFASRQNAERLARSLESRGFRMSVSPARTGSRMLWRVRAGPAHDRAGAQHLAARLRQLGHRGELLPVR